MFFVCILSTTVSLSQPQSSSQIPNQIKLGVRVGVPVIAKPDNSGEDMSGGFCYMFRRELEAELRQINQNLTVKSRIIKNQYKGSNYPRWGSLLTKDDSSDKQDLQCGPNSRQSIENDQIIFSDSSFYETGIKLLLKKSTLDKYVNTQSQNDLAKSLDNIRSDVRIGVVKDTTTFERLKASAYKYYGYDERRQALKDLDEDLVLAFAGDGIILRALFEDGSEDGKPPHTPYKDRGYVIFPDGSNYLAGKTEKYSIAISNKGISAGYSRQLLSVINQILEQSRFQQEKINLENYELGKTDIRIDPPGDDLPRNILLSLLSVSILSITLFVFLKKLNDKRSINPHQVHQGTNTIVNVVVGDNNKLSEQHVNISNMSTDLAQASAQIQDLVTRFQQQGLTIEDAQRRVANDIASQVQKTPTMTDKLKKWGQSLGDATVSDIAKEVVKLAIRTAGIPLP